MSDGQNRYNVSTSGGKAPVIWERSTLEQITRFAGFKLKKEVRTLLRMTVSKPYRHTIAFYSLFNVRFDLNLERRV